MLHGERRTFLRRVTALQAAIMVGVGLLAVGCIDYVSGLDVRIFPLYFLPLTLAGQRLGQRGATLSSLAATAIWVVATRLGGQIYDSDWIWVVNTATQGSAFLVLSLLVARLEQRVRREHELSRTDALTGLLNSRAFLERGADVFAEASLAGRPLTLAYIDLDHFKQLNDREGHKAGDRLLETVGTLLHRSVGAAGLVARIGGDEFAVLLPDRDEPGAAALLGSLHADLTGCAHVRDSGVRASIGAITRRPGEADLASTMRQADALMYAVKRDGGNAVRLSGAAS